MAEIEKANYTVSLTRKELKALDLAFDTLRSLEDKYPNERLGFHLDAKDIVAHIHRKIKEVLE